jgi:hypothetical protein
MSSAEIALFNLYLQAGYVFLTLVLAGVAIWSILKTSRQSRDALAASKKQSEEAIAAVNKQIATSEQQSKDALAAVNRQIEASEMQSKAAIDAVHEQIEASEKQAQETLFNQFKPVIVPGELDASNNGIYALQLQNKGTGIALNAWGIYTIKDDPILYCFFQAYSLAPNEEVTITSITAYLQHQFNAFEREFLFPKDGDYGVINDLRLTVTYEDAFNNKYSVIFDHSKDFRWKNVVLKRVEQRLDEFIARKRIEAPPEPIQ